MVWPKSGCMLLTVWSGKNICAWEERIMMDYVSPKDVMQEAVQLAKRKSELPARDLLIRGILAGAFLGYATSLVFVVVSQGLPPIVGAILFPVGFVILVLLGMELVTGNFALLPAGVMAGKGLAPKNILDLGWGVVWPQLGRGCFSTLFFFCFTNMHARERGGRVGLLV